jgi:lysophospholipase L1-like esterase
MGKSSIRNHAKANRKKPPNKKPINKQPISKKEKIFFNLIFISLILLTLVLIELGLRIAGYGIDTHAFIKPRYKNDIYVMNQNIIYKYFPRKVVTKSDTLRDMMIANQFSVRKPPNTLRGFVVGESTAQGFPYESNQSFSKITELALGACGKYKKVELLNLGISAITSYCIKDIALKLLPYQPDFLVIYAGHNEYYGTLSATTGGNYFTKNLYLTLKESRLFQLLFNLQNSLNPAPENTTLMEEQFNQQILPPNPKLDQEVAADFIKNIDGIVKAYNYRSIPVIVIEPVSNLYDMPPFAGEKDSEFKEFIESYTTLIKKNNRQELADFYQARLRQKQYDQNANIRYLDAVSQTVLTGKPDLNGFKSAKDLDTVPFRAKETLVESLQKFCASHSLNNPNLSFIPLSKIMTDMNDNEIFGNKIFIDQLHFTQAGQRMLSRILADRIAEIFQFNDFEKNKIARFYTEDAKIEKSLLYLTANRIDVYLKVRLLLENAPFNKMLLPYQRKDIDGITEANLDPELVKLIFESRDKEIILPNVANYYLKQDKILEGKMYLDSYLWIFPACYRPYLIQARFGKTFTGDLNGTFANYKTAYLLSDKMKMIYDEIAQYLADMGRDDLFQAIKKYGRPN